MNGSVNAMVNYSIVSSTKLIGIQSVCCHFLEPVVEDTCADLKIGVKERDTSLVLWVKGVGWLISLGSIHHQRCSLGEGRTGTSIGIMTKQQSLLCLELED